jgi:hypothetical protein
VNPDLLSHLIVKLHHLVSELWLIQMARRVSDYRIRRIADRGNEEDGPDSRARGDRFYPNRRSADRGNEKVDRDPGNVYDYPPVYDEYKDEDWYLWFGSHDCQYDEEIDEEGYVPIRKIPKNPFMFVQDCAVVGKQAAQIRSPLDRSDFWICYPRLIDARSDRWDFRFEFSPRSYDFTKLLFVQVCTAVEKQPARVRSPLDRSDFWICGSAVMVARFYRRDCRLEHFTGSYDFLKLLQFVFDYEKHTSLNNNDECKIVPFDPGGFEGKLEDEFFQRWGE